MNVRASDLYQATPDVLQAIEEIRHALQVARVEVTRLKNIGQDTAQQEQLIAAAEAQLTLYADHFGPGSAARYARQARQGQI